MSGTHALWSRRTDVPADDPRAAPRRHLRGNKSECRAEMRYQQEATSRSGGQMPFAPKDYLITSWQANGVAAFRELDENRAAVATAVATPVPQYQPNRPPVSIDDGDRVYWTGIVPDPAMTGTVVQARADPQHRAVG